ncbi:tetratricopeptide repeat protein [Armatimonas rosea]|uniref:Tetratricopeptide (TPR) repeat protein n=1 Tax=Armatimonas rosea TaxID=685828 RepID=A0A7W9SND3_ARMRO|nr:tetratricopeptide repeat protein [Armatimonas rosea]MBB6049033.1 tetratricopeptide (TPR) repeat protein [Armatimonas rosea]
MQWACPQCGNLLKKGESVCRHCGAALALPPALQAQWEASARSTSRTVGWVLAVVLIGGVVIGGGLALNRAFKNASSQMGYATGIDDYNKAAALYAAKDYERAASAFERIVQNKANTDDVLKKSTEGACWSYRELGHLAQNRNDLPAALRWYKKALDVKPDDAPAKAEYDAVARILDSDAPAGPSNVAPPADRITQFPKRAAPGTPQIKASDFESANSRSSQEAQSLLTQANDAYRSGNTSLALKLWSQVVGKSPGSAAATEAQGYITQYAREHNPFDQGG